MNSKILLSLGLFLVFSLGLFAAISNPRVKHQTANKETVKKEKFEKNRS